MRSKSSFWNKRILTNDVKQCRHIWSQFCRHHSKHWFWPESMSPEATAWMPTEEQNIYRTSTSLPQITINYKRKTVLLEWRKLAGTALPKGSKLTSPIERQTDRNHAPSDQLQLQRTVHKHRLQSSQQETKGRDSQQKLPWLFSFY